LKDERVTKLSELLVLSGLPASGKTTRALEWAGEDPEHRRIINWDQMRLDFYGRDWKFNRAQEDVMQAHSRELCNQWLKQGMSVVIDNTNLTERARERWHQIAMHIDTQATYSEEEIDTPVGVCVERDLKREKRVGRAVIERMALFHGFIDWADPVYTSTDFVICDIDGTLSDPSHRLHYVKNPNKCDCGALTKEQCIQDGCKAQAFKPRWDRFHAEVNKDKPKSTIIRLLQNLYYHYNVLIVSGRSPEHGCGIATEQWLDQHEIPYHHLFMRAGGDYRPDYEHKQQILDLLPKERIAFVLDDRQQVVDMWRKNGLICLQVAEGAF
jgi:predicted kinase